MAYIVNNTRGQVVAVVDDGTINTSATSLTLLGKNYSPYGEINLENLVKQLENFANSTPPSHPQEGQIWYDIDDFTVKVYTGTIWKPVTGLTVSNTLPTQSLSTGDLWWNPTTSTLKIYSNFVWQNPFQVPVLASQPPVGEDGEFYYNTTNKGLYISDGAEWRPVSSPQPAGFGATTWENTTLTANGGTVYPVIIGRVNNEPIAVVSADTFNLPSPTPLSGFGLISKGITVSNDSRFDGDLFGTALQATKLETARTINGVPFDGTANITVPLSGVVPVDQGGTGIVTVAPGEILIGATDNQLVANTITGTLPISVTTGNGSINIGFTGALGITGGTGISTSLVGNVTEITNTGVTNLAAGSGIGLTGANGAVTVTNTGVLNVVAGSGIEVATSNGNVTITNAVSSNVSNIVSGNLQTLIVNKDSSNVYTITALATGGGSGATYLSGDIAGTIKLWAGDTPPAGWFICDGSAVSKQQFATLYSRIGDAYGTSAVPNTFLLPDMRGRMAIGVQTTSPVFLRGQTGGNLASQLPVHSHSATFQGTALSSHSHDITDPGHNHTQYAEFFNISSVASGALLSRGRSIPPVGTGTGNVTANTTGITIQSASAGTPSGTITVEGVGINPALGNLPPYTSLIWIIKMEDVGVLSNFLFGSEKAGAIKFWSGQVAPEGWVFCRGQTLSKTTYPTLFDRIGYLYGGSGDDFKVPNYAGRFPLSAGTESNTPFTLASTGGYADAILPSHTHTFGNVQASGNTSTAGSHTHTITDNGHGHPYVDRYMAETVTFWNSKSITSKELMPGNNWNAKVGSGSADQDNIMWLTYPSDTSSVKTGITINSAGSHDHTFTASLTGSTSTAGQSAALGNYPPYLVTNAIIKLEDDLVSSLTPGRGIAITGVGNVTITNTGVTSLTAGSGVTLNRTSGDIVISAAGGGGSGDLAGSMKMWAGSAAPDGWQFANGNAVSRTTYAALFSRIGTAYGSGDGSTTFNLPNMVGRVGVGSGPGWDRGIDGSIGDGLPVGTVVAWTRGAISAQNQQIPAGWLLCNGSTMSRTTESQLFDVIGTTYNTGGESSTVFRLPDYRAMFLRGLDEGRGIDPQRQLRGPFQKGTLRFADCGASPGSAPGDLGIFARTSGSPGFSGDGGAGSGSTGKNIGMDSYGAVRDMYQPAYVATEFPGFPSLNTPVLASTIIGGSSGMTVYLLPTTASWNQQLPDGYYMQDAFFGVTRPHNQAVRYIIKARTSSPSLGYLVAPWIIKMSDSGLANGQLEAGTNIDLVVLPSGATQINSTGGGGGGGALQVQQNSVNKGVATTLNFTNSQISVANNIASITVPAGGGEYAGTIKMWSGSAPPDATYAFCDGNAVSRTTYSVLFSRIGTTYGAGDGSTTFNLPDFRNRFPVGAGSLYARGATGGSKDAVVVTHRHELKDPVSGAKFFGINDYLNDNVAPAGWQRSPPTGSPVINAPQQARPNEPYVHDGPDNNGDASYYGYTDNAGESGTDKNLPPYLGCFYVIKLTDDGFASGTLVQGNNITLTNLPNGQTKIDSSGGGGAAAYGTITRTGGTIPNVSGASPITLNIPLPAAVAGQNMTVSPITVTGILQGIGTFGGSTIIVSTYTQQITFVTPLNDTNYTVDAQAAYTSLTDVLVSGFRPIEDLGINVINKTVNGFAIQYTYSASASAGTPLPVWSVANHPVVRIQVVNAAGSGGGGGGSPAFTGATWKNVTSSRTAGTTYTNNSSQPLQVSISALLSSGPANYPPAAPGIPYQNWFFVDSLPVAQVGGSIGGGAIPPAYVYAIVPPGGSYRLASITGVSNIEWRELSGGTGGGGGGGIAGGLGINQTWQNVLPSRASNTTYTNTTGLPIQVAITAGSPQNSEFLVDSVNVARVPGNVTEQVTAIIPPGSTYRINQNTPGLVYWAELR
jgi:microcystin-dependent protein